MSHSTAPIAAVVAYQTRMDLPAIIPVVTDVFRPDRGWVRSPWRKRISRSYARTLRREGVTRVGLAVAPGRVADFGIAELVR